MRLHDIQPPPKDARRNPTRKGQGIGSGKGKTAGRGQKGQMARSGSKHKRAFEGGQMPLQQRLPKRGFTNIFKIRPEEVNVEALNCFKDGTEVTPELLQEAGLIKKLDQGVKVLGRGKLEKNLTVKANRFSQGAIEKIEAAGGKAEVV